MEMYHEACGCEWQNDVSRIAVFKDPIARMESGSHWTDSTRLPDNRPHTVTAAPKAGKLTLRKAGACLPPHAPITEDQSFELPRVALEKRMFINNSNSL